MKLVKNSSVTLKMIIALFFLYIVVVSCDKKEIKTDRVGIEQKVKQASFLDGTFYVETRVWVNDGKGSLLTLEDSQFACVKAPLIDSIKTKQLKRAVLIKQKLIPIFSN